MMDRNSDRVCVEVRSAGSAGGAKGAGSGESGGAVGSTGGAGSAKAAGSSRSAGAAKGAGSAGAAKGAGSAGAAKGAGSAGAAKGAGSAKGAGAAGSAKGAGAAGSAKGAGAAGAAGRKRKAEQSCLDCVESYCEDHLQLHERLHRKKRHQLLEARERLQENICSTHRRLLELYCLTDQQCVCHLCITDTHTSHHVLSIQDQVDKTHRKFEKMQSWITEKIHVRENKEQELRRAVEAFETSAEEAVLENEKLFTEFIQFMKERQSTVRNLILTQKKSVIKQTEELMDRLRQEVTALKKREDEVQQLKQISQEDNIRFLQGASSMCPLKKIIQVPVMLVHPHCSYQPVTDAVSDLMKKLHLMYRWRLITISERLNNTGIVSSSLPTTRQELLKYATKLTLDLNTVHDNILLNSGNTVLTTVPESMRYRSEPERFERRVQVLCSEGLRGAPRYWEVKCGIKGSWVSIAVAYKGIRRKGKKASLFGRCQKSWALRKHLTSCEFWHDDEKTCASGLRKSSTIGVYLDHGAGILAFYSISDQVSLIHKVQTRFTEPVYAGFGLVGIGTQIKICDLDSQT